MMKTIVNSTNPTEVVKNTITAQKKSNIFIDFVTFPKWTHSVRVGDYTNQLQNEKQCSSQFYTLVNKLLPYIQQEGSNLFNGPDHCHLIQKTERKLAVNIIEKIHGIKLGDEIELWQLSYGGGTRLVSSLISGKNDEDIIILYPLFIDHHHLIYPNKNYNQKDLSKKGCSFTPQDRYK